MGAVDVDVDVDVVVDKGAVAGADVEGVGEVMCGPDLLDWVDVDLLLYQ